MAAVKIGTTGAGLAAAAAAAGVSAVGSPIGAPGTAAPSGSWRRSESRVVNSRAGPGSIAAMIAADFCSFIRLTTPRRTGMSNVLKIRAASCGFIAE